jgi:N-acetylglutamate synthase-like GNAT family acetyltransferase
MKHFALQDLSLKAQESWVLVVGNPIMACAVASPLAHSLYIRQIAVDPRLWGQGVAQDLVGFVKKFLEILDWIGLSCKFRLS